MSVLELHYDVPGDDFTRAGEASGNVKTQLKKLGFDPAVIRNVVIALYEGEINMVIHAGGGEIDVSIEPDTIHMVLPTLEASDNILDVTEHFLTNIL